MMPPHLELPGLPRCGSPLGVCVLPEPPVNDPRTVRYGHYVHEILGHAGLCYDAVEYDRLAAHLASLKLLVTAGEARFPDELGTTLASWVEAGGCWISVAGACGMETLLGVEYVPAEFALWGGSLRLLGEGFLDARGSTHPVLRDLPLPLHFFNGIAVSAATALVIAPVLDPHHRPTGAGGIFERAVGRGRCILVAVDVPGTVVHIQQGIAVTRDGWPAPDGTGSISDGALKTDDGQVLDWVLDREPIPGVPGLSAFLQPVADQWREVLLRSIFYAAEQSSLTLPLLWLYPHGLPALGHLSHDTDGNDPELGYALLEALAQAEAPGTWCVILPGYARELIGAIRDAGHELAAHYNAVDHPWSEPELDRQWQGLRELFEEQPATNKNHFLRWQGDTEFFDWCAERGIRLEQSKGVSKTGGAGFNFGTCHPHTPVAPDGRLIPVLELPTPTQDLVVFAPPALLDPLLDAVARHHGILHLLFHPAHIRKPGVAEALVRAVRAGKERGMAWWTGRQIGEWEARRRRIHWQQYTAAPDGASVVLTSPDGLDGATLLWLDPSDGEASVERWGFRFRSRTLDLPPGESVQVAPGS